jgi:hypothetical protein
LAEKTFTKKLTKIAGIILGVIVVLLVSFHFWFVNHAEELIENMVSDQSHGKLKLDIHKFKFNWFSRKMELQQAVFISTDTVDAPIAYRFRVSKIKVQVEKVWPLIFEKKILIDSIQLIDPEITVTKIHARDSSAKSDTSMSIPQEMGHIYNSIQDALQVLKVNRFQIDNGTFSLINKIRPEEKPIVISRLYFNLDNLQVDTTDAESKQKILFSDNVSLHTTNQDILFPDGRHRLSFSNFRINIRSRMAEFDSCTIMASKGDSSTNSFRIFFDKLRMTNIDFDTLYHTEVIKADSVYCINPRFQLAVELSKSTDPVKPPKLNELIQQLTGNMELGFVAVQNGSFDINTMRDGHPSSFTSDHNNFEVQGLRIRENALRPLTVERFVMAIRNYENFLRDSAYAIQFDSILLNDNRISLSNFTYKELDKNNKVINKLNMPQFELQGLSWDDLVFDQQLAAKKVTLIRPVINYNIGKSKSRSSRDVFQALAGIGKIMQLDNLDIINGQVNLTINKNVNLQLQDATMTVSAKQLVDARRIRSIQRSVSNLNFTKGVLTMGDITARLENVRYNGDNNGFTTKSISVDKKNAYSIKTGKASVNSMVADDKFNQVIINGVNWQNADINFSSFPKQGAAATGSFVFKDIHGTNTKINAQQGDKKMSLFLNNFSAEDLSILKGKPLTVTGLVTNGSKLDLLDNSQHLTIENLSIADRQSSELENIVYHDRTGDDSVYVSIPSVSGIPDINAILQGKIYADNVKVIKPHVDISRLAKNMDESSTPAEWKDILIGNILIIQPSLHFVNTNDKGTSSLDWKGEGPNNSFELKNLKVVKDPSKTVSADQLHFSMDHFVYTDAKGKKFDAKDGRVIALVDKLILKKNEAETWDWKGIITNLAARNFVMDSLGKNGGTLTIDWAKLSDLAINSSYLLNLRELVKHNTKFNLREITGNYHNANMDYKWYNAGYDKKTQFFSVDSFSLTPVLDRDTYVKAHPYQTDYMTAHTGAITVGPFDVQRLIADTVLDLGIVNIYDGFMTAYRDKRIPREPGLDGLLPVPLINSIPIHLTVDTINLKRTQIEYEEVNEKTKTAGKITVARLNGTVADIRNFNLTAKDSLRIKATAYLQDTMFIRLHVKVSYTDSLGGFLMTGSMGPADLTILNPVLIPLASAELKSAKLDTMSMQVVGREKLAYGEMNMYYHDLKVRITRPGETNKKTFFAGVVSFFANTIIKNRNDHRTGVIYFERLHDRSAINYLVKIAMSGMTSSIGIQKNKRLAKKHRKEILDKRLPPPDTDHL